MTTRKDLFSYMNLETRERYLAHRKDFEKNVNRWKLTPESRKLLMQAAEIAWDTETISVPPPGTYQHLTDGVRKNLGLTYLTEVTHVAFYAQEAIVVLVAPFTDEELDFARQLFSRKDCLFIGHNGVFDYRIFCGHHDIPLPTRTYCTLVGQTTMMGGQEKGTYPDGSTRSLQSLTQMYNVESKVAEVDPRVTPEWVRIMKENRNALHTLPAEDVSVYVVTDVVATYWVYKAQMYWSGILQEQYGYTALMERHKEDQQYQNVLNYWAIRGMPVNREWIQGQLDKIEAEKLRLKPYFIECGCGTLAKADEKFRFIFGVCHCPKPDPWQYVEFENGGGKWYPADMQGTLWTDAGFDNISENGWKTDKEYSRWYSTSNKAVAYYLKFGPEEHRSKLKLYDYYTSMIAQEETYREWLDHSSYDGKAHPQMSMTANTSRTIGSTPNPLNLNMHAPQEIEVYDPATGGTSRVWEFTGRGILAPHKGRALIEFDLSNAEVRFAAILSRAKGLCLAFAEHRNLHKENAAVFYGVPVEQVTKQQRSDGKSFFFGMQYGAGAHSLASNYRILIPVADATEMVRKWNEANWEVGVAKKRIEREGLQSYQRMLEFPIKAARQAYTVLWNGRWVPAPTQYGKPKLYPLWNTQQQGGVGGIAVKAINAAHQYFKEHPELGADIYTMIHDSLVIEIPDDNWEAAQQAGLYVSQQLMTQIPLEMTVVDGIPVPWPSDCDLYENKVKWGWQPDREFPYFCGNGEGEVMIAFPEDEAWAIMCDKAMAEAEAGKRGIVREITALFATRVADSIPWYNENKINPCVKWERVIQYLPEEHYAQSRFWGDFLRINKHELEPKVISMLDAYREWVEELHTLDIKFQALKERYEWARDFKSRVRGQTS